MVVHWCVEPFAYFSSARKVGEKEQLKAEFSIVGVSGD